MKQYGLAGWISVQWTSAFFSVESCSERSLDVCVSSPPSPSTDWLRAESLIFMTRSCFCSSSFFFFFLKRDSAFSYCCKLYVFSVRESVDLIKVVPNYIVAFFFLLVYLSFLFLFIFHFSSCLSFIFLLVYLSFSFGLQNLLYLGCHVAFCFSCFLSFSA